MIISKKLLFSKVSKWSNFFKGGGSNFFKGGGGVQMLISIQTHITCDFPGGSGPPTPSLDPHM